MLSPGVARPDVGSGGSSPPDATGQTPPVDFCNLLRSASTSDGSSEPRAPRSWSPTCAAVLRTTVFRRRNGLRVAARVTARPIESSRARGQLAGNRPLRALAPPAAIARGGSFAPTRSARTPHVASSWRRRLELAVVVGALAWRDRLTSSPDVPAFAERALQGRLARPPAKGITLRRTRGAFRPRTTR